MTAGHTNQKNYIMRDDAEIDIRSVFTFPNGRISSGTGFI